MGGGMRPEDVYELVNAGDPRISPDGRASPTVTAARRGGERVPHRDLGGAARRLEPSRGEFTVRREARRHAALVSGRAAGSRSPRTAARTKTPAKQLYVIPADGGEAAQAHRPEGERRGDRLVARLDAHRVRARVPRRGVRRGGRAQARAAPLHARLLQARQRRLDRRPAQAPVRRRPRRRRAERSSRAATSRTTPRRGHPTASGSSSTSLRGERWDDELVEAALRDRPRRSAGRAAGADRRTRAPRKALRSRPTASLIAYRAYVQDGTDPHHRQRRRDERGRRRRPHAHDVARPSLRAATRIPASRSGTATGSCSQSRTAATSTSTGRRRRLGRAGAPGRGRAGDQRLRRA